MKVLVLGALSMVGKSAKTGAAYDMKRLYVASPMGSKLTDAYRRDAAGFEVAELEVESDKFAPFLNVQYPCQLDLITDMRLQGGKLLPVVVGVAARQAA